MQRLGGYSNVCAAKPSLEPNSKLFATGTATHSSQYSQCVLVVRTRQHRAPKWQSVQRWQRVLAAQGLGGTVHACLCSHPLTECHWRAAGLEAAATSISLLKGTLSDAVCQGHTQML